MVMLSSSRLGTTRSCRSAPPTYEVGSREEEQQEHKEQMVVEATATARQAIFTEVWQSPRRSSYVLVVEVTTKVQPLRSPPSSNHEG